MLLVYKEKSDMKGVSKGSWFKIILIGDLPAFPTVVRRELCWGVIPLLLCISR